MPIPKIEITKHWSDPSGVVGYAEGGINGREFTASWATFCPLGAVFYDSWLDSTVAQTRAIARVLAEAGAVPAPRVVSHQDEAKSQQDDPANGSKPILLE